MDPANFVALGQNLDQARPIFDDFCARYGFSYANPMSLGRYPRIRVDKVREIRMYFDLWMALDANGRYFEHYSPDLPYELGAGVWIDVADGTGGSTRFASSSECLAARPLSDITPILLQTMEEYLPRLESWSVGELQEKGRKVPIRTAV
jgi:hypothetical protein